MQRFDRCLAAQAAARRDDGTVTRPSHIACDGDIEAPLIEHKAASFGAYKRQDNDVALAALETLDRIYRNPGVLEPRS